MKYIYITLIFFLFSLPCSFAKEVETDMCTGIVSHDYTLYWNNDEDWGDKTEALPRLREKFHKGEEELELMAMDIHDDLQEMEDFGRINYAFYRDNLEIAARDIHLTDCHIEASDKPPYYKFVANHPLEHFLQSHIVILQEKYERNANFCNADAGNASGAALDALIAHKNMYCADNWRFCFNVDLLVKTYPEVKRRCIDEAAGGFYKGVFDSIEAFEQAFNLGSNQLDRNSGIVTLFDEFSEGGSSQAGKKTDRITKFSCSYSMEDGKVIESNLN